MGSREAGGASWGCWLAPDVGTLAAAATLAICLLAADGPHRLFGDADSGWHIRTGEMILATGALPRADPFSFTKPGQRWLAWEWGSDVLMAIAHQAGGLAGVAWLYACVIAFSVWLWFRLHWSVGGNFWLACIMAPPMLSTASLHWLARPHMVGWVLALAALWFAEKASPRFGWRDAAWIFLGSALWANLHASFFLVPLICLVYAAGHWLGPLIWEMDEAGEHRRARWFLYAGAISLLGSLVNPYGAGLHMHVAGYLADSELLSRIGEYQTFNFHAPGAGQIMLAVGLAGLGAFAALAERRLAHCLLLGLLLVTALRVARGLPMLALLGLPLANGAITAALEKAAEGEGLRAGLRRWLAGFLAYSRRLRAMDARMRGLLPGVLAAALALAWLRLPAVAARTGFPPDQFPVAAAAEVAKLPLDSRIMHTDKFGGYLIYRFRGERKVFFDGRSDFYGAEFLKQYGRLMRLEPGWREYFGQFGFTHALLPSDSALACALQKEGWKRLYADKVAVLLERPRDTARGPELAEAFGV